LLSEESSLIDRIERLEAFRTATAAIAASGVACDAGPYDPEEATGGWHTDGEFVNGETGYQGIGAIRDFFAGLSATFTLHIFTNIELQDHDVETNRTTVHCYGLEAPSLAGVAHFGAFTHLIVQERQNAITRCRRWCQRIHLITPALAGWVRGPKIADQTS
jgi:hypothetical protein